MKDLKECLPYYLNTGLKMQVTVNDGYDTYIPRNIIDTIDCYSEECVSFAHTPDFYFNNCENQSIIKPCLLPLSALTEPLEDGTIHIYGLLNAKVGDFEFRTIKGRFKFSDRIEIWTYPEFAESIGETIPERLVDTIHINSILSQPFYRMKYLFKHHFDIWDLIGSGLAIDKRTVKQ